VVGVEAWARIALAAAAARAGERCRGIRGKELCGLWAMDEENGSAAGLAR
jgi:hypothetical protein